MDPIKDFDTLPDSAILLRAPTAKLVGDVHPNTLARWTKEGDFPPALQVGALVGYRVRDVRAWLAGLHPVRVAVVPAATLPTDDDLA